jgi:hypothetical protein
LNYTKIYNTLFEKAKLRGLDKSQHEGYFEIHHILPVSLGGSNDDLNLVMFTGREHFIAHMLMWKANPNDVSLQRAAWMMSARNVCKVNSKLYSAIQEVKRKEASEQMKGRYFKDLTGNRYERLVVVSQGEHYYTPAGLRYTRWNCVCDCGNETLVHASSLSAGNTRSCGCLAYEVRKAYAGKVYDEETKKKFRYLTGEDHPSYGTKYSEERKAKTTAARKAVGYELTEEQKLNRKLAGEKNRGENNPLYGKTRSDETVRKMSEAAKALNLKPWEVSGNIKGTGRDKWLLADYYFDLWLFFGKPATKKFAKCFNETHNDTTKYGTYVTMLTKFINGWIPLEDEEWINFSKGG